MKRSVTKVVLYSIFTLGIYSLYWIYRVSQEVNELTNENKNKPSSDVIFTIITLGLYSFYWFYKIGLQLEKYEEILTMKKSSVTVLSVVIAVLFYSYGGPFISMALIQNEINKILDEKANF